MSKERIGRARQILKDAKLDGLLVTNIINVRYLSGFTGTEGTLLIGPRSATFFTDSRYTIQAGEQIEGASVVTFNDKFGAIAKKAAKLNVKKLGFEGDEVTVNFRKSLGRALKGIKLAPLAGQVSDLRLNKDLDEIAALKAVIEVSEKAFKKTLRKIVPGAVEIEVARFMEIEQIKLGAIGTSFDTIVASGPRGALPHGVASNGKIKDKELVVFDWGAIMNGYNSDQTMTVPVGKVGGLAKKIYEIVYEAQQRAIEACKPGITGKELDLVARKVIEDAGYGKYFGHGLGHGVGMEIHEGPRASRLYLRKLEAGQVVTIEPGIYLPGKFGVRLEDMILITETGYERLTTLDKRWKGR
jgi:Xaa-Pro aminopeptidase